MAPLRLGFTVTKKVGNAVVRNRARRRLRAAADRVMPGTGRAGWDYVLIGRAETLTRPFERLCEDLERAVAAVHEGRGQRRGSGGGARKGDTRKNKKDATGKKSGKGDERGGARRPSAGKAR
jgi:ribonuclease P protein component